MVPAGRHKIAIVGIQQLALLTYKHLNLAFQDNAALVKGVFMSGVFIPLIYLQANHD